MTRRRLDAELVRRGLTGSPAAAREAVEAGIVQVAGVVASKPATMVADDVAISMVGASRPFVSRAGQKLAAALDRFDVDPVGCRCLDAGASTGGFTDVLLRRGAAGVVAVDVGYGQLAWELRTDPRVTVLERTNIRDLTPEDLAPVDLVVADLSFISLRAVLPTLRRLADARGADGGPREAAVRGGQGSGGRGRCRPRSGRCGCGSSTTWSRPRRRSGSAPRAAMASPLLGPAGNVEFLVQLGPGAANGADLAGAVAEGVAMRS